MAHTKSSSNIVQYDSNGSVRATSFRYNQNSVNTVGGMTYYFQSECIETPPFHLNIVLKYKDHSWSN